MKGGLELLEIQNQLTAAVQPIDSYQICETELNANKLIYGRGKLLVCSAPADTLEWYCEVVEGCVLDHRSTKSRSLEFQA